jgi:hypothetical protein
MKIQNELQGNAIDWNLPSLIKESKFMDSDQEIKMAILKEIAEGNSNKQSIAALVNQTYDRVTAERKLLAELDKISKTSNLAPEVTEKHYGIIKTSVTSGKLTDPFLAKGFDCLEWQNIVLLFQPKVSFFEVIVCHIRIRTRHTF